MNEPVRKLALFIRDVLGYDEQLIRMGRLEYDRELLTAAYIGVDQLAPAVRLSSSQTFDGVSEEMTYSTRWRVPCVIEFFGEGAYQRAASFINLAQSQAAIDANKAHSVGVYIVPTLTDVKALTGSQYGERILLDVNVTYETADAVATLRIDEAVLDIITEAQAAPDVQFIRATVEPDGVTLTVTFGAPVAPTDPLAGWSITVDGPAGNITGATLTGTSVILTVDEILQGAVVTISYTGGDVTGLGDISGAAVTNNSAQTVVVVCAYPLNGDIAAIFGGQPLDISDQTVSKTVPSSPPNTYVSGGPVTPVSWAGWRAIGYQASDYSTASNSFHIATLISSSYTTFAQLIWSDATSNWIVQLAGGVVGSFAGNAFSKVGFRVDGASGDAEVFVDGASKTKADIAGLGGLFSGLSVIAAQSLGGTASPTLTEGDEYSADLSTSAPNLSGFGFPVGTDDWCGNAIP